MQHWIVFERDRLPVEGTASAALGGCPLSKAAAEALWQVNRDRPGFCSRDYSGAIRLEQYCGVLAIPGGSIEILPKVIERGDEVAQMTARHALLRLLSAAPDLNLFERDTVGQADCRAPLLDLFVAAFLREASRQAALGLIQSAVADEESLTALRGRFLAGENVRRNTVRPDRLHCRFDDLTVDNPLNRYVRAAIERSQRMITRSATHRLWMETRARYDRVSAVPLGIKDSPSKRLTRSTRRYSRLLSWADRILSMSTPSLSSGGDAASGLLFDMQKLFEHAVYLRCIKEAGAKESVSRPRGNLPLARHKSGSEHFGLRPDVVITGASTEQISRIVDAKWKWIDTRKHDLDVSSNDIHQVATYAMRYGCTNVCLIYPAVDGRDANESKKTFRVTLGGTMPSASPEILISIRTISVFS